MSHIVLAARVPGCGSGLSLGLAGMGMGTEESGAAPKQAWLKWQRQQWGSGTTGNEGMAHLLAVGLESHSGEMPGQ